RSRHGGAHFTDLVSRMGRRQYSLIKARLHGGQVDAESRRLSTAAGPSEPTRQKEQQLDVLNDASPYRTSLLVGRRGEQQSRRSPRLFHVAPVPNFPQPSRPPHILP